MINDPLENVCAYCEYPVSKYAEECIICSYKSTIEEMLLEEYEEEEILEEIPLDKEIVASLIEDVKVEIAREE